ncbi:MAG: hypothetical protein L3J35_04080 [Bacteroidales bacterium]|nr:hypothetical protein [Bacteroidales bacterium]
MQKTIKIESFSEHLFWDVDRNKLDFEKNKQFIVERTLDYGLINDWNIIYNYYGIKNIAKISTKLRNLDKKSISFISILSKIPKEDFLCYTMKQLTPKHWDF